MLENKLFEALLDVIPFGAYAVDIETYEVVYANKIVRENMYAPQETYCWEKVYGQEEICPWCSIHKHALGTLEKEDDKHTCEFFDEIDDRWIKSYDEFMTWPDGRKVKYSILVDTTDQKAVQGSMIQSHAKLAVKTKHITKTNKSLQITKLKYQKAMNELKKQKKIAQVSAKSKAEFLANMSHEIRTPMNGITGMLQLLKNTDVNPKQSSYIEKMETASNNLLHIINDILDFSKIEAGKLSIEKIDFIMVDVLSNLANIVKPKAQEKGLDFSISFDDKYSDVFLGDPYRIGQILINLANNAVKFTAKGTVGVEIEKLQNNIVRFSVSDTGIGLDEDQQENLFQSFAQADGSITRRYGGTGLGLSISKQLVELMDGTIWCESELGIGSKFIFDIELPKGCIDNLRPSCDVKVSHDITSLKGSNVLLVEDNAINQEIVLGLLEKSGIILDIANNGMEAVEKFYLNPNKYEMILMDIQMPILNGYEASKKIRDIDTKIPIVALSANVMQDDIKKTIQAGMNDHLNKPIEIDELYEVLLKYIAKKIDSSSIDEETANSTKIPDLENINVSKALKYLGGNEELYFNLLDSFRKDYKNLNLDNLDDKSFELIIHTLKGLSGNICATNLHKITIKIDETHDRSLLDEFYKELKIVVDELENKLVDIQNKSSDNKKLISDDLKKKLFSDLIESIELMEPNKCEEILKQINSFTLNSEDSVLIEDVQDLLDEFDYNGALKLFLNKI
jgi:signal transduction histidine kinase/CheY-like chemotaxis protein